MKIEVLDHGYVEFIESWGHGRMGMDKVVETGQYIDMEAGIIEAARQSTQGSFRGWEPAACDCGWIPNTTERFKPHTATCSSIKQPGDAKLLEFLYSHKHFTPFEFAGMVIEVQAPIFVFREWHRHRTQSYNEMSARYAPLPDLYYQPKTEDLLRRAQKGAAAKNKQESSSLMTSDDDLITWNNQLLYFYREAERLYKWGLDIGVPKELARCPMPVGHYSRMRASANLRNWLAFMTLRCDPDAQWEIRQFAESVASIIEKIFPRTYELWQNA